MSHEDDRENAGPDPEYEGQCLSPKVQQKKLKDKSRYNEKDEAESDQCMLRYFDLYF